MRVGMRVGVGCGGSPEEPQRVCVAWLPPWMGEGEGQLMVDGAIPAVMLLGFVRKGAG